jgi:hypothetical protein
MVGAFPGMTDDFENERLLQLLLNEGVTTFVCLQREYDPVAPEALWRAGVSHEPGVRCLTRPPPGPARPLSPA